MIRERRERRPEEQRARRRSARERVVGLRQRGYRVRYKGQKNRSGGFQDPQGILTVPGEWVNGRLTNAVGFREYAEKHKKGQRTGNQIQWYEEHRGGREEWLRAGKTRVPTRPGVRIRGEPHQKALEEAARCARPTVGFSGKETYVRDEERVQRLVRRREVDEYV